MDTDIIWSAGFLDGEGCLSIKRHTQNRKKINKSYTNYHTYICVGMADKPENRIALETLKKLFGGFVCGYPQYLKNSNKLDTIQWSVTCRNAENCAKMLLPYLKIKKKNAEIIVKYYKNIKYCTKNNKEEEMAKREMYWNQMRKLNVKGKITNND